MAQTITPDLETKLASKLQVGNGKPEAEIEIGYVIPGFTEIGSSQDLNLAYGTVTRDVGRHIGSPDIYTTHWVDVANVNDGNDTTKAILETGSESGTDFLKADLGAAYVCTAFNLFFSNAANLTYIQYSLDGTTWVDITGTWTGGLSTYPGGGTLTFTAPITARYWAIAATVSGFHPTTELARWAILGAATEVHAATRGTATYRVASLDYDRSRKMAAAQLDVLLSNEIGAVGWYTGDGIVTPNNPIQAFVWLGDHANRVCVFTGLIDRPAEHRNPKQVAIKARSRMKWLLEQGFVATGPQGADDDHPVRTEDNGVYLSKTIEYIVGDILDRAGWPSADRVIATTGITLAEYVLTDRGSWADQIAGSDRLTTAAGCDFLEDELGVAHFEPSPLIAASEPDPAWVFTAGTNVMALDHQVDDENRATRVEVSGPMTSSVPIWKETWSTSRLSHPAGVWYDPTDSAYIRVIDRETKYIYRMKQSDRSIVSKHLLGGYPLGLSGDPTDSTHYYVLHAPWRNTGSTSGNSVKKYLKSTNALVSTSTLPNGRWSALKFDGTHLWLTNYDDGKLYKKTYVGGGAATAVASYTITYGGETQTQATGMWLNGTTLGLFFAAHKRFLLVDTSAPTVVTGTQSTKGTRILGGESDTTTDTDLYACAEAGSFGVTSGMVAKFALAEQVTNDVTALSVDWDLEDTLGFQSGIADRTHVDCPNDVSPHPFESRLAPYSMKVVQSLAQAQAVADAQLALLSRLRRVLDLGTIGQPAVQLNDPITYTDAIAGIDSTWVIDSYRARVASTYTQTMSILPWEAS